jgi:hypothetical protein
MTEEHVYRRSDALWRRTVDRVLILLPTSGHFLVLKGTGCDLWSALEQPGSVGQLAKRLSERYGVSAEQVAVDIAPFIEELARYGAVDLSGTCPSPGATDTK